jgi:hypothetical protein
MPEITPLGLQLKALWNPFRSERNILVGIFFLKLFDMIPFPMIFSTLQFNQVLGKVDIIALISIQFGLHTRCLPIDLSHHGFRDTDDFRKRYFSTKILKQTLVTFYHISLSDRRKEKRTLSLLREEA